MIKKKFIALLLAAATLLPLSAQQLPNPGFEEDWKEYVPWNSNENKSPVGTTPPGWNVANTIGNGKLGVYTLGFNVAGYNAQESSSTGAVKIINESAPMSQYVPGYVTLGTPWSTSATKMVINVIDKDGGTFGPDNLSFTFRPDAISFMYQANNKPGSAIVYLWSGKYEQADVPGNIVTSGSPTKKNMIDRDRHILKDVGGKDVDEWNVWTNNQLGGAFISSGKLIAYAKARPEITDDWTEYTLDINYVQDAEAPEKINVIFATGDYFTQPTADDKNNTMTVDDVKLLYYSRLASVSFGNYDVPNFDSKTYNYTVHTDFPEVKDVKYKLLGQSGMAKATVARDEKAQTITITVTNSNGTDEGFEDIDGKSSHTYVFHFPTYTDKTADINVEYTHDCIGGSILLNYVYTVHNYYGDEDPEMTITLHRDNEDITDKLTWWIMQGKAPLKKITRDEGKLVCDGKLAYVGDALKYNSADEAIKNPVTARLSAKLGDLTLVDGHEIELNDPGTVTGIENVAADAADAPVEYFNMQGMRIERPMPGTPAIRRQGSRVEKIIMK